MAQTQYQQFPSNFKDMFVHSFSLDTPVDQLWLAFKSSCQNCLDNIVPSKYSSTKLNQPWIITLIKRVTRKKQHLYNLARLTNATGVPQFGVNITILKRLYRRNVVVPTIIISLN